MNKERNQELKLLNDLKAKIGTIRNDAIIDALYPTFEETMDQHAQFDLVIHPDMFMLELIEEEYVGYDAWNSNMDEYNAKLAQLDAVEETYVTLDANGNILPIDAKKMQELFNYLFEPYENDKNYSERRVVEI